MSYTPGPWEVVELSTESPMFSIERAVHEDAVDGKRVLSFVVADLRKVDNREVVRANAHIIAAAPDLLKALQDYVDQDEYYTLHPSLREIHDDALAAIAKAKGE